MFHVTETALQAKKNKFNVLVGTIHRHIDQWIPNCENWGYQRGDYEDAVLWDVMSYRLTSLRTT
jgi:hypothetical protein